jgi:hypothetical protein
MSFAGKWMKLVIIMLRKISQVKMPNIGAGGVAQVVQHLPSKHEPLSSNHSTAKKQKNNKNAKYRMFLFICGILT